MEYTLELAARVASSPCPSNDPALTVVDKFVDADTRAVLLRQFPWTLGSHSVSLPTEHAEALHARLGTPPALRGQRNLPVKVAEGDVQPHRDQYRSGGGELVNSSRIAVLYLTAGGVISFEDGSSVAAAPGRLVMWNASAAHAFRAAPGGQRRAMVGPLAVGQRAVEQVGFIRTPKIRWNRGTRGPLAGFHRSAADPQWGMRNPEQERNDTMTCAETTFCATLICGILIAAVVGAILLPQSAPLWWISLSVAVLCGCCICVMTIGAYGNWRMEQERGRRVGAGGAQQPTRPGNP